MKTPSESLGPLCYLVAFMARLMRLPHLEDGVGDEYDLGQMRCLSG